MWSEAQGSLRRVGSRIAQLDRATDILLDTCRSLQAEATLVSGSDSTIALPQRSSLVVAEKVSEDLGKGKGKAKASSEDEDSEDELLLEIERARTNYFGDDFWQDL